MDTWVSVVRCSINLHDHDGLASILPDNGLRPIVLAAVRRSLHHFGAQSVSDVQKTVSDLRALDAGWRTHFLDLFNSQTEFLRLEEVLRRDNQTGDTSRLLLRTQDNLELESVIMRHRTGRYTVCVSCQVGCAMACRFCATASLGLKRNLTWLEILAQVDHAQAILRAEGNRLRNVVFMGMGEPLCNVDHVRRAVSALVDTNQYQIARSHITISTCGIIAGIASFAKDFPGLGLALSLHGSDDSTRQSIMPSARAAPLVQVMETLDVFSKQSNKEYLIEYLMIDGVNDSRQSADNLVDLLRGRRLKVNLIACNAAPHIHPYGPSSQEKVEHFRTSIIRAGIRCTVRFNMGSSIDAACGQLAYSQR